MTVKEELRRKVEELPEDEARRLLHYLQDQKTAEGNGQSDSASKPVSIGDILEEMGKDVPAEEWDRLPADLTDHLDHYLYGTPKT